jgi:hypothetical protein
VADCQKYAAAKPLTRNDMSTADISPQLAANLQKERADRTEARSKYCYFLLATAGACIGYGLQKFDGQPRTLAAGLPISALAAWAASFWYGCKSLESTFRLQQLYMEWLNLAYQGAVGALPAPLEQLTNPPWQAEEARIQEEYPLQRRRQVVLICVGVVLFGVWRLLVWWQAPEASRAAQPTVIQIIAPARSTSTVLPGVIKTAPQAGPVHPN